MAESGAAGGAALALQLIKRIDHVAEEMKSISNLNRVWCAQTHAISDAETTVTRDDLGAGMFAQPIRQGRRFIVGQHVYGSAYRQVYQQQAIAQWSSV